MENVSDWRHHQNLSICNLKGLILWCPMATNHTIWIIKFLPSIFQWIDPSLVIIHWLRWKYHPILSISLLRIKYKFYNLDLWRRDFLIDQEWLAFACSLNSWFLWIQRCYYFRGIVPWDFLTQGIHLTFRFRYLLEIITLNLINGLFFNKSKGIFI